MPAPYLPFAIDVSRTPYLRKRLVVILTPEVDQFGDLTRYTLRQPSLADAVLQAGGSVAPTSGMLKRTCWRYVDWHRFMNVPNIDYDDFYTAVSSSDLMSQCMMDLRSMMKAEATRRGMKVSDLEAEFEAKAEAEGWPSATGRL